MLRKDASGTELQKSKWRKRLSILAATVAISAIAIALNQFSGPQAAQAQGTKTSSKTSQGTSSVRKASHTSSTNLPTTVEQSKVVAVVNGQAISRQYLADECLRRYGNDVLESIVNKHLIWQECKKQNVEVTEKDVDDEITRLANKFGLSPGRWLTLLEQERDLSPDQYRREIIWPTLALRGLAASQIVISPDELRKAFETEYGPRVKVRAITVSSQEKANQLYAQAIAKPEEFETLAKDHSEDQSASVHGLIPPIRKHLGDPELERIAFGLTEGAISPVIQVANQYVILKCEQHLPETYIAPRFRRDAEMRVRDRLQDQKLRTSATDMFRRLQVEAKVENVFNNPDLSKQMPGVAATINGQKISIAQLGEECVVRYGKEVLEGEINRKILMQALERSSKQVTEANIDAEIARAADSFGYLTPDGKPDINGWLESVTKEDGTSIELYVRDAVWPTVALKQLVGEHVSVTEQDIQKGFVSNFGPRVEALAIVLNNQRQAQKVWDMARSNPTDQFFGELAHQYSVDAISRENFGKIPPIRRYGGRPQIEEEAFKLKPGELSGIIVSGENFIVLRCQGHTSPIVSEMDSEIRDELVKDIQEKKLRSAMTVQFDRLQEAAQIDNFLTKSSQAGARMAAPKGPVRR
jgi:parvulin-like peptidyl-prolyl isomerase